MELCQNIAGSIFETDCKVAAVAVVTKQLVVNQFKNVVN